jgi:class 3 adenylate cyclase
MSKNADDIRSEVAEILRGQWSSRDGLQVPEAPDVQLGNNAIKLDATVLYADLVASTNLVNTKTNEFAAEIYKCFLRGACRVIQNNGGTVTAFDGDRVMAVYLGGQKNTQAVGSAMEINSVVTQIINPMIKEVYPKSTYEVRYGVGVDTSPLFVARTGVRGSNDLVWVGRAANYAAKMCAFRGEGLPPTWITTDVFGSMHDSVKYSTTDPTTRKPMWEEREWKAQTLKVYCSSWRRSP